MQKQKKHNPNHHDRPKLVAVERRTHEREMAVALIDSAPVPAPVSSLDPSQRARIRAVGISQEQREARARREVLAYIAAAEQPARHVRDMLDSRRRRPVDAPMATCQRIEPQPPAGFPVSVERIDANRSAIATAASIALVAGCIGLALYLGGTFQ